MAKDKSPFSAFALALRARKIPTSLAEGKRAMPLYGLLKNQGFEPLQIEAMALAFEAVCVERKLRALNDDTARERIARLIIEVARTGELDPIKLRDKVTAILSTPPAA